MPRQLGERERAEVKREGPRDEQAERVFRVQHVVDRRLAVHDAREHQHDPEPEAVDVEHVLQTRGAVVPHRVVRHVRLQRRQPEP